MIFFLFESSCSVFRFSSYITVLCTFFHIISIHVMSIYVIKKEITNQRVLNLVGLDTDDYIVLNSLNLEN